MEQKRVKENEKRVAEALGTYGFHNGYMFLSAPKLRVSKVC